MVFLFKSHAAPSAWSTDPATIFDEERARVNAALNGGADAFLAMFPGKGLIGIAAKAVGLADKEAYVSLVCKALEAPPGEALHALGSALHATLNAHLPQRRV